MSEDRAKFVQAISQLSVGTVLAILFGGYLWLERDFRRFEATRADEDRNLSRAVLQQQVDQTLAWQARQEKHAQAFIANGEEIAEALRAQIQAMEGLKTLQAQGFSTMSAALRAETDRLLERIHAGGE